MPSILQQLNTEMASVVKETQASLVQIHSGRGGGGGGTIWHPEGLIVTNAHVVQSNPIRVTLADGRTLPARLLAQDSSRDLAALAIDATALKTVKPGNSRDLQPGQWVMALGHPWGIWAAVTAGVVIGVGEEWSDTPSFRRE